MALGQRQPVVRGVPHQSAARFCQALLQADQRPVVDPPGQHPPPQVPWVLSDQTQPQASLIGTQMAAARQRHLRSHPWPSQAIFRCMKRCDLVRWPRQKTLSCVNLLIAVAGAVHQSTAPSVEMEHCR